MAGGNQESNGGDPQTISQYVRQANDDFFDDAGVIQSDEWLHAAAGFIVLVVLGSILLMQVLSVAPSGGGVH